MRDLNVSRKDRTRAAHVRTVGIAVVVSSALALLVSACSTGQSDYDGAGPPDRGSQPRGSFSGEE